MISVIEVLELLANDPETLFYPPTDYEYTKVREKPVGLDFVADHGGCSVGVTYHSTRANVSLKATKKGWVNIENDVGLDPYFPTTKSNNYVIIKDGKLNADTIDVRTSWETTRELSLSVPKYTPLKNHVRRLNLRDLPIINYDDNFNLSFYYQEVDLKASIKVVKHILKDYEDLYGQDWDYTLEQQDFLREKGIQRYGYRPKVEKAEPTDFYTAREVHIVRKGFSSLPKVQHYENTKAKSKLLINDTLDHYETQLNTDDKASLNYLRDELKRLKVSLCETRRLIAYDKIAILAGFEPTMDEEFTCKFKEIKVEY